LPTLTAGADAGWTLMIKLLLLLVVVVLLPCR
jgi:hypothetical protein